MDLGFGGVGEVLVQEADQEFRPKKVMIVSGPVDEPSELEEVHYNIVATMPQQRNNCLTGKFINYEVTQLLAHHQCQLQITCRH